MVDNDMGLESGYEIVAPTPVLYLIGHSIELSLKSYLLHNGTEESELRTGYGHDLMKAFDSANSAGLSQFVDIVPDDVAVLRVLNGLYQSKELNYIKPGMKTFPSYGPLEDFAKRLLVSVSNHVGWRVQL